MWKIKDGKVITDQGEKLTYKQAYLHLVAEYNKMEAEHRTAIEILEGEISRMHVELIESPTETEVESEHQNKINQLIKKACELVQAFGNIKRYGQVQNIIRALDVLVEELRVILYGVRKS